MFSFNSRVSTGGFGEISTKVVSVSSKYLIFITSIIQVFQHRKQLLHRGSIGGVVAGVDEAQVTLHIYNEVATELGGVVAV